MNTQSSLVIEEHNTASQNGKRKINQIYIKKGTLLITSLAKVSSVVLKMKCSMAAPGEMLLSRSLSKSSMNIYIGTQKKN